MLSCSYVAARTIIIVDMIYNRLVLHISSAYIALTICANFPIASSCVNNRVMGGKCPPDSHTSPLVAH